MRPSGTPDERRIALAVRAGSQDVHPGWTIPEGGGNPGDGTDRAIEAQIVATVTGRKPLFFDPWGSQFSDAFDESYREILPSDVEVVSREGMLFIFRPETLELAMRLDRSSRRRAGESQIDSVVRISKAGPNGHLLGYGARSMDQRPAHRVRTLKARKHILYAFVSHADPALASKFASERAVDFSRAFGWTDVDFTLDELV